MRRLLLLAMLALVACDGDGGTDPTPPAGPDDIEWSAESSVVDVIPAQIQAHVTGYNPTDDEIILGFGSLCTALLAVHADEGRTSQPVWSQERLAWCLAIINSDTIPSGEEIVYPTPVFTADQILGDSLPDGEYFLTVIVLPSVGRLELPAGSVVLTSSAE